MRFILAALLAYLVGSLPTGYILGRMVGVDIRKVGSGNVGATNVTRVLGKRFGYSVFLVDFLKGFVAVLVSIAVTKTDAAALAGTDLSAALGGVFSVIGHSYPVWLGFNGGKGVATSLGVLFAINWLAALIMCVVWVLVFQLSRYVSLSSIAAAIALPVLRVSLIVSPMRRVATIRPDVRLVARFVPRL